MMIKNLALAVICLLLGSVLGYQLRFHQQGEDASSDGSRGKAKSASAAASAPSGAKATSANENSERDKTDLGAHMKALLENNIRPEAPAAPKNTATAASSSAAPATCESP